MQAIDSRKLPMEENLWLKSLSDDLDIAGIKKVCGEIARQEKGARIEAYSDAILRANFDTVQEAMRMADMQTIEKVFEEVGWVAKWEAKGEAKGREETARNALAQGLSIEIVQKITGLDMETIKSLQVSNN
jgi:predicted transposase YdaD